MTRGKPIVPGTCKLGPKKDEGRAFVARVMSRLWAKPFRMRTEDIATVFGIDNRYTVSKFIKEARGYP